MTRTLPLLAVLAGIGCKVSTNLDQVIALDISLPFGGQVEIGDTLIPNARALNGHGDSVAADFVWTALDTTILTVVDSTTGATIGDTVGTGSMQARVGPLRSNPVTVVVISGVDSIQADGPVGDTVIVSQPDSLSDSLAVRLFGASSTRPGSVPFGRRVVFTATSFPATGPVVTLSPNDTIVSNTSGIAATRVMVSLGAPIPDSVVVVATVPRPDGTVLPSTVKFVVEFAP